MRVLTADDWMLWRELRLQALTEAPQAFGSRLADWQGDGDREERWRDRLSIPGSRNLIATVNNKPVGMASGVPDPDDVSAELISLWVHPAARGQGVGDALIEAVTLWATRAGFEALRLAVTPANEYALKLYYRNGFRPTGDPGDVTDDGHREIVMDRRLLGTRHRPGH